MIELTRLNGSRLIVNSELIQYAESAPDTTLTLLNAEKVVVKESLAEVLDLAVYYRARVMGEAAKYSAGARFAPAAPLPGREEVEPGADYVARRRTIQD